MKHNLQNGLANSKPAKRAHREMTVALTAKSF
jgi:hypothetical protein